MRRRSPASSPDASVLQPGMTVISSPSKPSAAQCATATSIGTRGIPQVLWESNIMLSAWSGRPRNESEVLVDLSLIGVDGARLYVGNRYRPASDIRLEERIDQRDVAPADLSID